MSSLLLWNPNEIGREKDDDDERLEQGDQANSGPE
jgi:hypothetical protein